MSRRSGTRAGTVLAAFLAIVVVSAPGTAGASRLDSLPGDLTSAPVAIGQESWRMLRATNESRERFDLPPLRMNLELAAIARRHSMAMARVGSLFHTPDAGVYLRTIDWRTWGENIGYTPGVVGPLHGAFMMSPIHRENILNGAFRFAAIGSLRVDGTLWVTVFFYG